MKTIREINFKIELFCRFYRLNQVVEGLFDQILTIKRYSIDA